MTRLLWSVPVIPLVVWVASTSMAAAPVADFTMPRSTCLPPCAVFFDATSTTDSDLPDSSDRFRFLHYEWDFGDPGSGFWGEGARATGGNPHPKNVDTGPLAGHVYENQGTYTVTLSVFDGTSTSMTTGTVTIQDPEGAEWSGTETICISADPDHPHCPKGATKVVTSDFDAAVTTYCGLDNTTSSVRCLFERGNTFTLNADINLRSDGPSMIGAYGPPGKPKPQIDMTGAPLFGYMDLQSVTDLRAVDLNFVGDDVPGNGQTPFGAPHTTQQPVLQFLMLRIDVSDGGGLAQLRSSCRRSNSVDPSIGLVHKEVAIVECTALSQPPRGPNALFPTIEQNLILGSRIGDFERTIEGDGNEHVIRVHHWKQAVLAHNSIGMFTDDPNNIMGGFQTIVTVRAGCAGNLHEEDPDDPTYTAGWTSEFIISDNWFPACLGGTSTTGRGCSKPFNVGRQNTKFNEGLFAHFHTYIIERNLYTAHLHEKSNYTALEVAGEDGVIRNNVFDLSRGGRKGRVATGLRITDNDLPDVIGPDRIEVYHNTFYVDKATDLGNPPPWNIIEIAGRATNITVQNNLLFDDPNTGKGATNFIQDSSGTATTCASCNVKVTTNPFPALPSLPMTYPEAHLDPNNTSAVDQGITDSFASRVFHDQDMQCRYDTQGNIAHGTAPDAGSDELNAVACGWLFLVIDENSIDNGTQSIETISFGPPFCGDGDSSVCVNDDIAGLGVREILFTRGKDITPFSGLVLPTGEVEDEGLFRFTNPDPQRSQDDDAAPFTIEEFIFAAGAAADENNLDKIDGLLPLSSADILDLEGKTVCAVVYDGDVSADVKDNYASLKGATSGLTAFTVTAVAPNPDGPGGSGLPSITVDLLPSGDVQVVCESVAPPATGSE